MKRNRCQWPGKDELMLKYHDEEWGVPVHDDYKHYEFILLDGFQAGLSWQTIINKRENFKEAFDQFDFNKISNYGDEKVNELLENQGIIRNKLKIKAAITNAQLFIEIINEYGSFDQYIWQFVNYRPIINHFNTLNEIPAYSNESDSMSKALKKKGFKFVGTTICYAYMQAAGMVNDHTIDCFRRAEIIDFYKTF